MLETMRKSKSLHTVSDDLSSHRHYEKQYGDFSQNQNRTNLWSSNPTIKPSTKVNEMSMSVIHLNSHIYGFNTHSSQEMRIK